MKWTGQFSSHRASTRRLAGRRAWRLPGLAALTSRVRRGTAPVAAPELAAIVEERRPAASSLLDERLYPRLGAGVGSRLRASAPSGFGSMRSKKTLRHASPDSWPYFLPKRGKPQKPFWTFCENQGASLRVFRWLSSETGFQPLRDNSLDDPRVNLHAAETSEEFLYHSLHEDRDA